MKERIGAFSDMTGMSPETIRYYEQLGLLKPKRQHENHYRVYEARDLILLAQVKQFQGLGLSLNDIAQSVRQVDVGSVTKLLGAQRAACERELEEMAERLSRLKGLELDYQRLEEGAGHACPTRIRSMFRLMLSDPDVARHPATGGLIRELVALTPYSHTTVIIPQRALLDPDLDPLPTRYGLGILAHYAKTYGFEPREPIAHYPASRDLCATICVRDFSSITRAEISPLLDEFERRGQRVVSDAQALIRHVQTTRDGDRYYLLIHASFA